MKIINIGFVFMISFFLVSCSKGDKEADYPQLTEKEEKGVQKEFMPANDEYPKGYLDVVFGEVHIKAPSDYVAQNREDGDFFDLVVMYPSMLSSKEFEGNTDRKYDAIIRIMFEYKSDSFADLNEALKKFYEREWIKQVYPSERYPGLVKYSKSSGVWFYKIDNNKYLTNRGDPIILYCHTFGGKNESPENLNDCVWHIHIEDTSIRVNLKQSHLRDWPTLITKVSTFIKSLIVSGQPVARISS